MKGLFPNRHSLLRQGWQRIARSAKAEWRLVEAGRPEEATENTLADTAVAGGL